MLPSSALARQLRLYALMVALLGAGLTGCTTRPQAAMTQVATIDALLAGGYDGHFSCGQLRHYGDFGIGTFDHLDGEMVVLEGTVYQVKADGTVHQPPASTTTPFATVVPFRTQHRQELTAGLDLKGLEELVNGAAPNANLFTAVRVDGQFRHLVVRSVPRQTPPYRPLAEVTKEQSVFDLQEVHGTLVGFRSPAYVKGINVPGYHLHFLSDDRKQGGHVLSFELADGTLSLANYDRFLMLLPGENSSFGQLDLGRDRAAELEKVERQR